MNGKNNETLQFLAFIMIIMGIIFFGISILCIPAILQYARTPIPAIGTILCVVITIVVIGKMEKKKEIDKVTMLKIMGIAAFVQFLIYLPVPSCSYPYDLGEDALLKLCVAVMNQPIVYFIGKKIAAD